ncbi:MAG TPA: polysaccharide biosynthesis tyrosine autokinase [Croceibacterium sp.]|nr:polysaccharide biosynthesis tyrosine autokinase [Croceibacterium sp.]
MDATTSTPALAHPPGERAPEGGLAPLIRYALVLVRRNLLLIGAIVALMIAAAVVLTMLETPRYTATSTIEINEQTETVLGEELQSDADSVSSWDIDLFLNTQLEILRSRDIAERVVQRLGLASSERFFASMEAPAVAELPSDAARREAAVGMVRGNFAVTLPRSTRIAAVSFTSTDPQISAQIANAYAAEFIQASLQRKFDRSAYARGFVAEQLEEARARLESSERELNAYARQAGLIRTRDPSNEDANSAGSMTAASLMQLNEAANAAQAQRIEAEARWNAERAQPLFSSQTVLSSPAVQNLMTRRADLQARLQTARERYLADHPSVRALETELEAIEASLTRAANEARNSVQAQYRSAAAAESRLRGQVSSLQGRTLAEQDRSVRYNTLAREADTNRSLYDGLLQRYRELNAASGITASNIAVVDQALVPGAPSSPSLNRNLALAILLGLALAGSVVFLRDQLDDRLRVPEDVETKVGLPLLGVVPRSESDDPTSELSDPKSVLSESYNALRTSLLYSTRDGLPGLLLVTSAQAAEGKTTTSYAVARGFARVGKRVLLMDADLRRPSIHRMIGLNNQVGLSSLLVGEAEVDEAIFPSEHDGLQVLPAGPVPPSPAELLSSPRMAAVLEQLDRMFDLVVIDSAPVLGLADSTELAALADGVMLVVEADRGRGGQLKNALRRLRGSNPVLLGVVLTKFNPRRAGNAYSYYGYEYYRYDSHEPAPG